jgi:hypothetical protein
MRALDVSKVTRVVLVDYRRQPPEEFPLVYEQWDLPGVDVSVQDDGRTLKVFVLREDQEPER